MIILYSIGVFLIAMLGGSSLIIQIPYTLPLLIAATKGTSFETMLFLGLLAGLGSATGKLFAYHLADKLVMRNPKIQYTRYFAYISHCSQRHPHWIPLATFLIIATPIPDEAAIIPLATLQYGLKRLLVPIYVGKILHNMAVASLFYHFTEFSADHLNGSLPGFVGSLVAFGVGLGMITQLRPNKSTSNWPVTESV